MHWCWVYTTMQDNQRLRRIELEADHISSQEGIITCYLGNTTVEEVLVVRKPVILGMVAKCLSTGILTLQCLFSVGGVWLIHLPRFGMQFKHPLYTTFVSLLPPVL